VFAGSMNSLVESPRLIGLARTPSNSMILQRISSLSIYSYHMVWGMVARRRGGSRNDSEAEPFIAHYFGKDGAYI
jgi:hypothetical protein